MLERQQGQLVSCIQRLYQRLRIAGLWEQPLAGTSGGQPLTHDILAALNLLRPKDDGSGELQAFHDVVASPQSDDGTGSPILHGETEVRDRHDSFVDQTNSASLIEDTSTGLREDSETQSKPSIKALSSPDDWGVDPSPLDLTPDPFPIHAEQIQTHHHSIATVVTPPTTETLAEYNASQAQLFATLATTPIRRSVYTPTNSVHSLQSVIRPSLSLDMRAVHQRYPPPNQVMAESLSSPLCHDWARNGIMLDASDFLGDFRRLSQLGVEGDEGLGLGML
jgi:hypothetical protein